MEGRQKSDVCRYFLSCLQLANLGNIELISIPSQSHSQGHSQGQSQSQSQGQSHCPVGLSQVRGRHSSSVDGLGSALLASSVSVSLSHGGHFDGSFQFKLLSMDRAKTVM